MHLISMKSCSCLSSPNDSRNLLQVGAGPGDFVGDCAVQEVGGVPRGGAGAAAAEAGRTQEEEDHQQAQGDAPDRRVSKQILCPSTLYKAQLKRWTPGMVKFDPAVAFHFCLALPAAFTQPGAHFLTELCVIALHMLSQFHNNC